MYICESQIGKIVYLFFKNHSDSFTVWFSLIYIYFQKVEISCTFRDCLIIYQASLLFEKEILHSFIDFSNNASENDHVGGCLTRF